MSTNIEYIANIIDYIEEHLDEKLDLESLARVSGYSKYHLHRMFVNIVGFPVHTYVKRRRLTEAARLLIFTDKSIMDIALFSGYETQQSFTIGFKKLFKLSPQAFRKRQAFLPLQLKYTVDDKSNLRGDKILDIKIIESGEINLVGYNATTKLGFFSIGICHRKLNSNKNKIKNRKDMDFLIGLNEYSSFSFEKKQPNFSYYAAAEVSSYEEIPKGMVTKTLLATTYAVFCFTGKNQDTLKPVADYIYKEWFPQSTYSFNEKAMYDFAKYGEITDENGNNHIEYWVPIL